MKNTVTVVALVLPWTISLACLSLQAQQIIASQDDTGINAVQKSPQSESQKEQLPKPPQVKCSGNQISIVAENSTLASIFEELHRCTGVQIDAPNTAGAFMVYDNLGPGPTQRVLEDLLGATGFDYVIGASASNPEKVETILLVARTTETSQDPVGSHSSSATRRAFLQMREVARPKTPEEQLQISDSASNSAAAAEKPATSGLDKGSESKSAQPPENSFDPQNTPKPTSVDTAQSSAPAPDLKPAQLDPNAEKVASMQQMFEQRKKMMQTPNVPPQ